jgi:hypothetical protein
LGGMGGLTLDEFEESTVFVDNFKQAFTLLDNFFNLELLKLLKVELTSFGLEFEFGVCTNSGWLMICSLS